MSKRTPLGTSPNFATPPFNPTETEFHAYWGQYVYSVAAVNSINGRAGSVGSALLPNASAAAALANPEWSKLRVGDLASTAFDASTASGGIPGSLANAQKTGIFVCVYPGAAAGDGLAVWERLDEATPVTQTIRDAHAIVVAQDGYLNPLSVVASPPMPANNLNLAAAVGDVASITCDYLDPGDGTQLEQALLAAAAGGVAIDIRLRPCVIALDAALVTALPLAVPPACRLIGAGRWISTVKSSIAVSTSQEVFSLDDEAELIDLSVASGTTAGTPTVVASKAVVACLGTDCRVERCRVELDGLARAQPWGVWDPTGTIEVVDTFIDGTSQTNPASPSIAIVIGADPAQSPDFYLPDSTWRVVGCKVGSAKKITGFNKGIYAYNTGGGHVSECDFLQMTRPQLGVLHFDYAGAPVVVGGVHDLLPTVNDVRIEVDTGDNEADSPYAGVAITDALNAAGATSLGYFEWTAIRVLFQPHTGGAFGTQRAGYMVRVSSGTDVASDNRVEGGIINGCSVLGDFCDGIFLLADGSAGGVAAKISTLRVSNGVFKDPVVIAAEAVGIKVKTISAIASIDAVGIANCSCKGAPATGVGIEITQGVGSTISNSLVLGNNLTPNGGTAISDTGTGTEAAHNIL